LTLHERLAAARDRLTFAGISAKDAAIDVDLYARRILGWTRAQLLVEQHRDAPASLDPTLSEWVERRTRREPTAYIVGGREFWGLEFLVTPAVLIPRPETEFIVEEALRVLPGSETRLPPARLADIGTGSGCVAVAIAHEYRNCRIVASDISHAALGVARRNAERHGVGDRVAFIAASFLDGIGGTYDVITANPPYVKEGDKPALSVEVRHEPDVALFGGADGLAALTAVLDAAVEKLVPGGSLIMEFGYGQDDAVEALVAKQPALRLDRIREDLQGIPRTAVVQKA
jgi:release factor glutamine methyltransferase